MQSPDYAANPAIAPTWQASYARGVSDGRRTVEAELDAERQAIAVLANSMSMVVDNIVLHLNPADAARIGTDAFEVQVIADPSVRVGGVHAAACSR
jgi:hypothetical protein